MTYYLYYHIKETLQANFCHPRKMDICSPRLLFRGLRPQQKERDFASVHFNLDTQKILAGFLDY